MFTLVVAILILLGVLGLQMPLQTHATAGENSHSDPASAQHSSIFSQKTAKWEVWVYAQNGSYGISLYAWDVTFHDSPGGLTEITITPKPHEMPYTWSKPRLNPITEADTP